MNYLNYDEAGLVLSLAQSSEPLEGLLFIELTDDEFSEVTMSPWTWKVDMSSKRLVPRTKAEVDAWLSAPTPEEVNSERDRRLYGGVSFRGSTYDSDLESRQAISDAASAALMAMLQGAGNNNLRWLDQNRDFTWITSENVQVSMNAPTVVELCKRMVANRTELANAARILKDMDVVPSDYRNDKWWM